MNTDDSTGKALNISASAYFLGVFLFKHLCVQQKQNMFLSYLSLQLVTKHTFNEKHVDKKKSEETFNVGIKDDLALDAQHTLYASFFISK